MSRSSDQRLTDILERISAIGFAEELLLGAEAAKNDGLVRTAFDAILYDLLVIGEAVKSLPADITARHRDISWSDIAKMRDIRAHASTPSAAQTKAGTLFAESEHTFRIFDGGLSPPGCMRTRGHHDVTAHVSPGQPR